jgi:VWFA-related protein
VLQRSCSALRLVFLLGGLAALHSAPLRSQTATPDDHGRRVFKANAQIVVLDVVVTGKGDRPVPGLHKEDFLVSEDGHPQTITYFEEQTGAQPLQANLPALPPDVFTNIPRVKPGNSVTVLLLDSLNTPLADQSTVRLQTLKFLKTLQPGQRMAIFTLGTQLRFIQGFTDDPVILAAAINRKGTGTKLQVSPLLQSGSETAAGQETAAAMRAAPGGEGEDAAEALEQFMANQTSARSDARLQMTLEAFQELAHYLGGIPGRKNVAWFSGAFPVVILPNASVRDAGGPQRDDQEEVKKTDALLASAQVAIYPISSEGVAPGSFYNASSDARQSQPQVTAAAQDEVEERNAAHSGMDEIAKYTGGKAFYNTNGLKDALASVANNGSHFYTLTYSSPNLATDGRYRKIQVKLANTPGYQLAYRQGYYADDGKSSQAAAKSAPSDPLSPLMRPGLPDSTQIPLTVQVLRGSDQLAADTADPTRNQSVVSLAQGGDNHNLKGPVTRYTVHFFIPPGGLLLDLALNGHRQLSVDAALLVYDHDGKSLNWMLRQISLEMDAAHYATALAKGVNFRLQIDAPGDGVFLRSGVYDLKSNLAGTLEVPLSTIVNPSPAAASR